MPGLTDQEFRRLRSLSVVARKEAMDKLEGDGVLDYWQRYDAEKAAEKAFEKESRPEGLKVEKAPKEPTAKELLSPHLESITGAVASAIKTDTPGIVALTGFKVSIVDGKVTVEATTKGRTAKSESNSNGDRDPSTFGPVYHLRTLYVMERVNDDGERATKDAQWKVTKARKNGHEALVGKVDTAANIMAAHTATTPAPAPTS